MSIFPGCPNACRLFTFRATGDWRSRPADWSRCCSLRLRLRCGRWQASILSPPARTVKIVSASAVMPMSKNGVNTLWHTRTDDPLLTRLKTLIHAGRTLLCLNEGVYRDVLVRLNGTGCSADCNGRPCWIT